MALAACSCACSSPARSRARLSASGDHRLAMMWAIAGLIARGVTEIEGFEVIDVSYPAFAFDLERLRGEAWPL